MAATETKSNVDSGNGANDNNKTLAETDSSNNDIESTVQKLPYPKSIAFIISNEFCERFMYYGMRTILVLYLTRKLGYDDDIATVIYHTFTTLVYFMCVFGAILSDSWLGKFNTILYLSIVYALGSIVISLGAIPDLSSANIEMTILGLALVALGSGGIKPCVAAFGGDQFKMPEQAAQMATFFSIFYFAINSGSLISTTITPMLRADVHCFGDNDCFPLAFGVPGMLMIVSIIIFVCGKFMYIMRPTSGNMVVLVSKCIANAISTKRKEKRTNPRAHWLDYSTEKYGKQLVKDTKVLLKILVLYIPLPVFWALFDQQGSRWTFQATRMDPELGSIEVKPDQMQLVNPLLILLFIPLYDVAFYPLLSKLGIRRPLQKLTLGGIFGGIAFLLSGIVELELEKTYPVLAGAGECQFRVYNTFPCDYTFEVDTKIEGLQKFDIAKLSVYQHLNVPIDGYQELNYKMYSKESANNPNCPQLTGIFNITEKMAMSYFAQYGEIREFYDDPSKSRTGDPVIRILVNSKSEKSLHVLDSKDSKNADIQNTSQIDRVDFITGTYRIFVDDKQRQELRLQQGAVYNVLINDDDSSINLITQANSLHVFWLIPQYVIMTLGEVMYSVTGLQFSYAQAPDSMKSVIQACWQLTVAFGNLIDVIVVGSKAFDSQASEFFLFAGLMFADMGLFMILAWRYKPVGNDESEEAVPALEETKKLEGGIDNSAFKREE